MTCKCCGKGSKSPKAKLKRETQEEIDSELQEEMVESASRKDVCCIECDPVLNDQYWYSLPEEDISN